MELFYKKKLIKQILIQLLRNHYDTWKELKVIKELYYYREFKKKLDIVELNKIIVKIA